MGLFSRSKPATHFPEVHGVRLDDTPVTLPRDLPADVTLLIVSFQDATDDLSDQWARLGERLKRTFGHQLETLELPVVARSMKLFGGLATLGVRGQIDSDEERARTIPIFVDKTVFCKTLACNDKGDVYIFLVDREGRIAWRGDGHLEMHAVAELEAAITSLVSTPPPETEAS